MRILLAIDGSEPSETAARVLSARPWPKGSTLRILSVIQNAYYPAVPELALAVNYDQMTQELVQGAEKLVARMADSLCRSGITVETRVRHGDPRVEIVDDSRDWGADLIVVGSHGRTGLKRWIIGSVAEYVVRHAPCAVEVVRIPIKPSTEQTSSTEVGGPRGDASFREAGRA